ncbi:MAG: ABC transporter ATP-binding protein, partial [Candidatus Dormibacteraceae bacterium]
PPGRRPAGVLGPRVAFRLDALRGTFRLRAELVQGQRHLALLGPSGAGKSFTLRLIAGLDRPPGAEVRLDDRDVSAVPAERRRVGYVPQDDALLPGRTVWQQVLFGVGADPALASHWLAALGLSGLQDRLPEQLSGGQRRRVAIVRALAVAPSLLLLDEPFTGLDAPVRSELRRELRRLQRATSLSTILVTHDAEEAATLADSVLLIEGGRVAQSGPQPEVYAHPASALVARLLGIQNVFAGEAASGGRIATDGVLLPVCGELPAAGTPLTWSIRPEEVRLVIEGGLRARVDDRIDLGTMSDLELEVAGGLRLIARVATREAPGVGERCSIVLSPEAIVVWGDGASPSAGRVPADVCAAAATPSATITSD